MGTCGGGRARSPYETITSIELDTLLGATRQDSLAWDGLTDQARIGACNTRWPKQHVPSRLMIMRLVHWENVDGEY